MSYFNRATVAGLLTGIALVTSGRLGATTLKMVNATDNIYGAGLTSAPGGGTVPTAIVKLPDGAVCVGIGSVTGSTTCASKLGCITLNNATGDNLNDPDGKGAAARNGCISVSAMPAATTARPAATGTTRAATRSW
jgi:hypothetical protein